MGSGTKNRKDNDSPIIRRPKQFGNTSVGYGGADTAADLCKVSFDVRLNDNPFVKEGVALSLDKTESGYALSILGIQVGRLNDSLGKMINTCRQLGVLYKGVVVRKNSVFYGRFIRYER